MVLAFDKKKVFLSFLFLLLVLPHPVSAASLMDYHIRVHEAGVYITWIISGKDEDESLREYEERVENTLYEVRSMLPREETVQLKDKTMKVNNGWLHEAINQASKLQSYDPKRKEILMQISERLTALDNRLTELDGQTITDQTSDTRFPVEGETGKTPQQGQSGQQPNDGQVIIGQQQGGQTGQGGGSQNPNPGGTPQQQQGNNQPATVPTTPAQNNNTADKEKEKAKMNEILRREEYSKRPPEESAMERFWNRLFNRQQPEEEPKEEPTKIPTVSPLMAIVRYLIIGAAAAFIIFVIYKLAPRFLRRERKVKKEKREPRVILGEKLEEDQTAKDILAEAETLARAGDIRAAIRKGYIALLCELGDRKVLDIERYKTNRDYLRDVRAKVMLYASMEQMTNSFERHWYGFEPTNENDWNNFKACYQQAMK